MNKKQVYEQLRAPNGAEQLAHDLPAAFEGAWALFLEGDAPAAGLLARAAKQKQWRQEMVARLSDRAPLHTALQSDSFKMRKNAARLAGALGDPADAAALIAALEREDKRMVRPSQLLALGALQCAEAEAYLRSYQVTPAADPSEESHCRAEQDALKKALSTYCQSEKHLFIGLDRPMPIQLTCPAATEPLLAKALQKAGVELQGFSTKSVRAHLENIAALEPIRYWQELLFVFMKDQPFSTERIGECCKREILPFLKATHRGNPPFSYRLELRNIAERGKVARALVSAIDCPELINNPSAYEVEFRLTQLKDRVELCVKLFTLSDNRFDYRKKELPASIHPTTAAGVLALVGPYLKENAVVADPCCGSGTMLLERAQITKCRLMGVDIVPSALEAAHENSEAAQLPVELHLGDARFWKPTEPLDEVISNLPFGNRVGGHRSNQKLYESLVRNLAEWLRPGGIAVLYTMEMQLLRRLVLRAPKLVLVKEYRTDAGGLHPTVFLIQRKK